MHLEEKTHRKLTKKRQILTMQVISRPPERNKSTFSPFSFFCYCNFGQREREGGSGDNQADHAKRKEKVTNPKDFPLSSSSFGRVIRPKKERRKNKGESPFSQYLQGNARYFVNTLYYKEHKTVPLSPFKRVFCCFHLFFGQWQFGLDLRETRL